MQSVNTITVTKENQGRSIVFFPELSGANGCEYIETVVLQHGPPGKYKFTIDYTPESKGENDG